MNDSDTDAPNWSPVIVVLFVWFCLSLSLNLAGIFKADPSRLPIAFGLSVVAPPLVFLILYLLSQRVRSVSLGLDLRLLTAIQG